MIQSKEVQLTVKIYGESRETLFNKLSPFGFRLIQKKELLWSSHQNVSMNSQLMANETRMVISNPSPTGDSDNFLITFFGELDGCQAIMSRFFDSFEKIGILMVHYNLTLENHSFKNTLQSVQDRAKHWKVSMATDATAIIDTPFKSFNLACMLWDHKLCFMTRGLKTIKNINAFIDAIEGDYNASIQGYIDVFVEREAYNIFTYEQFGNTAS